MTTYARPLVRLLEALEKLPGVGPRSAERMAFHLLRIPRNEVLRLAQAIADVKDHLRFCEVCFNLSEADRGQICQDASRDAAILCIVEEPKDVLAVEKTGTFRGLYHVLLGAIAPLDGVGPELLKIDELMRRLSDGVVQEVIHRRYEVGIFQFLEAARLAAASDENPFIFIFSKLLEAVDNDPANWKLLLKTPEGAPAILLTLLDKGRDVSKAALKTHVESLVRQHDNGEPTVDIELNVHLMQVVAEELLRLRLEEPDHYSHERLLNQIRLMTDMLMRDIEA